MFVRGIPSPSLSRSLFRAILNIFFYDRRSSHQHSESNLDTWKLRLFCESLSQKCIFKVRAFKGHYSERSPLISLFFKNCLSHALLSGSGMHVWRYVYQPPNCSVQNESLHSVQRRVISLLFMPFLWINFSVNMYFSHSSNVAGNYCCGVKQDLGFTCEIRCVHIESCNAACLNGMLCEHWLKGWV